MAHESPNLVNEHLTRDPTQSEKEKKNQSNPYNMGWIVQIIWIAGYSYTNSAKKEKILQISYSEFSE